MFFMMRVRKIIVFGNKIVFEQVKKKRLGKTLDSSEIRLKNPCFEINYRLLSLVLHSEGQNNRHKRRFSYFLRAFFKINIED
jgi:hypothetical protein